ncbi:MAG: DnaD domain protein [Bacilli bacterium]|nr:DnaD domain protein [Bacilli bacterium]
MNKNLIDELLRVNNNLIVPSYLIKYISKLNLDLNELIMILYFLNNKEKLTFNPKKISQELYIEQNKVLEIINNLQEKGYISIEISKENKIIEEYISLDMFFAKINSFMIDNEKSNNSNDIYSKIEKEFGRTLSPVEYETISKWIEGNVSQDLIESALKESILNNAPSIRYIDKILFEWNKKGYKTSDDIVHKKNNNDEYIEEIYDYDWLNE